MIIKKFSFYKAKENVNGSDTPGGYFYITDISGDTVKFKILPEPNLDTHASEFSAKLADIEKLIDSDTEPITKFTTTISF